MSRTSIYYEMEKHSSVAKGSFVRVRSTISCNLSIVHIIVAVFVAGTYMYLYITLL